MKKIESIEEIDKIVDDMIRDISSNDALMNKLKTSSDCGDRWWKLEKYIIVNLDKYNLSWFEGYETLWVREIFFYEMQRRTGVDFGFCEYFIPGFRNRAKSILENDLTIDMWNYCTHGGGKNPSTCAGTDRDICIIKNPERKQHYIFSWI